MSLSGIILIAGQAMHFRYNVDLDSSTSNGPASSTGENKAVVEDQGILWDDFCNAFTGMTEAMDQTSCPQERIVMMDEFWANIQSHAFRSSGAP